MKGLFLGVLCLLKLEHDFLSQFDRWRLSCFKGSRVSPWCQEVLVLNDHGQGSLIDFKMFLTLDHREWSCQDVQIGTAVFH